MMRSPIVCPYCGNQFEDTIDARLRKKTVLTIEEAIKSHGDPDFSDEGLNLDDADTAVLDDDIMDTEIDVMKIKEFSE
jgi:hypothetical protein